MISIEDNIIKRGRNSMEDYSKTKEFGVAKCEYSVRSKRELICVY